jgi:Uma2 family endonuclease
MGETGVHVDVMLAVLEILRRHYSGNDRVAVLASMFVYHEEGDPTKVVCPDVFVTLNVPRNTIRRTFKVWEEGKGPDLVIEITSKETRKEDLHKKFDLYRDVLGVREYFLFDPLEEYLEPSLQGFRLIDGRYGSVAWAGAGLFSEVLGLRLERDEMDLRFFDHGTGRRIPTGDEFGRAEADARLKAEAENERLRREIEALRRRLPEGG